MHDIFIALCFLALFASPAIVAAARKDDVEDDI